MARMFNVAVKLFWEGSVEAKDEKAAQIIAEERAAEYAEVESSEVMEIASEAVHVEKPEVDSSIFCAKCLDEFLGVGNCSEHEPRFRNRAER